MSVNLLSFPFRLNSKGNAVVADDASAEYCAERLTVILGTQPGERPLTPSFGVNDPAFESFAVQALTVQVALYGLPVEIGDVSRTFISDAQEHITVRFDMAPSTFGGKR